MQKRWNQNEIKMSKYVPESKIYQKYQKDTQALHKYCIDVCKNTKVSPDHPKSTEGQMSNALNT